MNDWYLFAVGWVTASDL